MGATPVLGTVGDQISLDQARQHVRSTMLSMLLRLEACRQLSRISRCHRLSVTIRTYVARHLTQRIADEAMVVLSAVLGTTRHVKVEAIVATTLSMQMPIEIDASFELLASTADSGIVSKP